MISRKFRRRKATSSVSAFVGRRSLALGLGLEDGFTGHRDGIFPQPEGQFRECNIRVTRGDIPPAPASFPKWIKIRIRTASRKGGLYRSQRFTAINVILPRAWRRYASRRIWATVRGRAFRGDRGMGRRVTSRR